MPRRAKTLQRLAEEQAALRRVATLVAEGAPPEEVFSLVAQEIARVTGLELIVMGRFDPGRVMTSIGAAGEHPYQPGTRWPLDGGNVSSRVLDTGRPVTIDPYARDDRHDRRGSARGRDPRRASARRSSSTARVGDRVGWRDRTGCRCRRTSSVA